MKNNLKVIIAVTSLLIYKSQATFEDDINKIGDTLTNILKNKASEIADLEFGNLYADLDSLIKQINIIDESTEENLNKKRGSYEVLLRKIKDIFYRSKYNIYIKNPNIFLNFMCLYGNCHKNNCIIQKKLSDINPKTWQFYNHMFTDEQIFERYFQEYFNTISIGKKIIIKELFKKFKQQEEIFKELKNQNGDTILHRAIKENNKNLIKNILKLNSNLLNVKNKSNITAFELALSDSELLKFIINLGYNS